eukprot:GGOE01063420.1.p2 GENE.GGOE01063420.1~~GGOE01063420.1.p2  ORF type:complete len:235 (-),score=49.91 GGOE01063420.1:333-1037(-)
MLKGLQPRPTTCGLDSGCTKLVWGNAEGYLQVWDVAKQKVIDVHRRHTDRIHGVAFSPCGSRVASSSSDRVVRIGTVNSQAAPVACKGHFGAVFSCLFDPLGAFLLSASEDGMVKLWNSFTGALLQSFDGHRGPVHRASFSADGLQVLAASSNGRLKVWDRETASALAIVHPPCERISCFAAVNDWIVMCALGEGFQASPIQLWRWRMGGAAETATAAPTAEPAVVTPQQTLCT